MRELHENESLRLHQFSCLNIGSFLTFRVPYLSRPSSGEWRKPHKNAYHQLLFWETACTAHYSRFGQETIIGYGWHLMLNSLRDQCSCGVQSWSFKAFPILYVIFFTKKILYGDDAVQLDQHTNSESISLSGEVHHFLYGLFAFSCRWQIYMMRVLDVYHSKLLYCCAFECGIGTLEVTIVQEQPKMVSLFY